MGAEHNLFLGRMGRFSLPDLPLQASFTESHVLLWRSSFTAPFARDAQILHNKMETVRICSSEIINLSE